MKNLWIEITVQIKDDQYNYKATKGEGSIEFTFPEELLNEIYFDKMIDLLKKSAYVDYKNNLAPEPMKEEEN